MKRIKPCYLFLREVHELILVKAMEEIQTLDEQRKNLETNDVDSGGDGATVRLEDGVSGASYSMWSLSLPSSVRSLKNKH